MTELEYIEDILLEWIDNRLIEFHEIEFKMEFSNNPVIDDNFNFITIEIIPVKVSSPSIALKTTSFEVTNIMNRLHKLGNISYKEIEIRELFDEDVCLLISIDTIKNKMND